MFMFSSQFLKTDVTAVKIYNDFLLAGIGNFLHIFDKKTLKEFKKYVIFEGQKVYGIVFNKAKNKILLYGGRCMKIFEVKTLIDFDEISFATSSDWILDAKWIDDDKEVATVTMHNKLHIWNENLELITELQCEEKCILYSAYICYEKIYELTVLSGTVFSEVLIWKPTNWQKSSCMVLKRLQKHNGVIFSVHYNEASGYICSSSDDRSAVLWKVKRKDLLTELEQKNIEINPICQTYGHVSRIFRCKVLKSCFITAGEDAFLNIWSLNGKLLRKVETHQGGPIWALDSHDESNCILTGGGDCGVTTFPINCKFQEEKLSVLKKETPKSLVVVASNNFATFSENGVLYYYVRKKQKWQEVQRFEDLRSYALVVLSGCRKMIALAGFHGQIYVYREVQDDLERVSFFETRTKSRIFSLHWLNCETFLICQADGKITLLYLKKKRIWPVSTFILPASKERWTTAAAYIKNHFVVGDRKGNIHLFRFGKAEAIQTLRKVHSHLGITNIVVQNERIMSLGRNGVIKTFLLNKDGLHFLSSDKLPFTWLVNIIDNLLLAFSGNNFVIWSLEAKRVVFEKSCGGGHRSWDFLRNINTSTFCYIKDKIINIADFRLSDYLPLDVVEGHHIKEVNTLKTIKVFDKYLLITGGEDTTLRINLCDSNGTRGLVSLKSHLSSIRTIIQFKIDSKSNETRECYLLFSAGGRAQIICWKLYVFTENNMFKNIVCSEQHSYYKPIDCEESEMRIMDLCVTELQNKLALLCACSDGNVKVFSVHVDKAGKYHLTFCRDIFYKLRCTTKICNVSLFSRNILITMATDGKIVFWDITNVLKDKDDIKPFHSIQAHQSGINSSVLKLLPDNICLFLTGGDDNALVLNLIKFNMISSLIHIQNVDSFIDTGTHCAQITGVFMKDKYFITASIDQRVAIFEWRIQDEKIVCNYLTKYNTSVADVQGLNHYDWDVFVYGRGVEFIKIKKNSDTRFYFQ